LNLLGFPNQGKFDSSCILVEEASVHAKDAFS
jgi:hypothetical protein